jgi:hypothetical protein
MPAAEQDRDSENIIGNEAAAQAARFHDDQSLARSIF